MAIKSDLQILEEAFERGAIIGFAWNGIEIINENPGQQHLFYVFENVGSFQPIKSFEGFVNENDFHNLLKKYPNSIWTTSDETVMSTNPMTTWKYFCTREPNKPFWQTTSK